MTSDPTILPASPRKPIDTVVKPSVHSSEQTEDAAARQMSQPGTIRSTRPTAHHNIASDQGQERVSQAHFADVNGQRMGRNHDKDIEANLDRSEDMGHAEGRAHTLKEWNVYGSNREGRQVHSRASEGTRLQHSNDRQQEKGDYGSYVEVEGIRYKRLQEQPQRDAETNVVRPKEAKVVGGRAYASEEWYSYRPSKEDRQVLTRASDAIRSQHSENRRNAGVENSDYRSHMEVGGTPYARVQEQAPKGSRLLHDLDKTLQDYEREKRDMIAMTNAAVVKLEEAERRSRDLEARLERQSEELRMTVNQLRQAEALRQQTLELLEAKASELREAQAFMSKEDSLSGADIIGMVKSLNAEILQVAAFMADSLEDLGTPQMGEVEATHAQSAVSLGKYILRELRSRQGGTEVDPMSVQIALQASLVNACKRIVDGWVPGFSTHDPIFDAIYARVRDTEGQSISGRWRAMTRSQIRNLAYRDAQSRILEIVMGEVREVFLITGYSTRQLKKHNFMDKFRERLETVGKLAYRIQEAIGEGITSDDFRISIIGVGERFDPTIMDDTFLQDGSTIVGERVAGTTDLGLVIQATARTSIPTILKKPKVVLSSAFELQ